MEIAIIMNVKLTKTIAAASYRVPLILVFLVFFIYSPRIIISEIEGATSFLRLDVLVYYFSIPFLIFFALRYSRYSRLTYVLLFLFLCSAAVFLWRSSFSFFSWSYFFIILGFPVFFMIPKYFYRQGAEYLLFRVLINFIYFNVAVHLLDVALVSFGVKGFGEFPDMRYGIFGMPYSFALFISLTFFALLFLGCRFSPVAFLLFILAILFGDSRVVFGLSLFLALAYFYYVGYNSGRLFIYMMSSTLLLVLMGCVALYLFPDNKAVSIFITLLNGDLLSDPSLSMRLVNYVNYMEWLDVSRLFFGGGVLAHLEYSTQYGMPGPLDVLFLRVLTEYGLVGLVFFVMSFFLILVNSFLISVRLGYCMSSLLIFLFVYSFFNEGMFALKVGHLVFLVLGLLFWGRDYFVGSKKIPF